MPFKYDRKNKTQTLMLLIGISFVLFAIAVLSSFLPPTEIDKPITEAASAAVAQKDPIQQEQERTSKQAQFCSQSNAGTPEPAFTKAYEKCLVFTKNSTIEDFDKALSLTSG